ncbi:YfgM family protein [Jeongeupia chitinilytica]|uniref:Ancillary SecYEG translocon subunit n=1 Tax=Jeongeupia chitinilytica TaxID=1041641 RepID=A0ABQ3GZG7_9NEIS|nr:tetratricopeptide repeat protein [Jeongeupia chitinilytica]GHD62914.1 membrane protein [Jeongeupia chitinilytica]
MAFDLQEQEQIAEFKAWWNDWGKWLAGAVVAALAVWGGWAGWEHRQASQAHQAGDLYSQAETQLQTDPAKLAGTAKTIEQQFGSTGYAARASLLAAKADINASKPADAEAQVKWAIANAKEAPLRDVARLRLAAIQLDAGQFDAALATLQAREDDAYTALFAEARGDVLVEKGDKAGARDAYRDAQSKLPKDAPNLKFVEVKLEALGKD